MKRILPVVVSLVFLSACGTAPKKGCKDTGCSAGSVCNTNSGACETIATGGGGGGGGGGAQGGGAGGGTGGGSTGGGGSGADAGVDAGVVIDPFNDGGVFVPGDICTYAIPVTFDGGSTTTLSVDLAAASNQYAASCNQSTGDGNDLVFAITFTEPKGLVVTATDTSGKRQDGVLSLVSSPCASFREAACTDETAGPEVLTVTRVPAGTWYVVLENYADDATNDGTYDVQFEVIDSVAGPANDSCSAAQALVFTNGLATVTGTTELAFNDTGGQPLSCSADSALGADVFYSFTLTQPQDVRVTIDVPSSSVLSPAIAVTAGCGVSSTERACDTALGVFTARNLGPGTYFVVVDGDGPSTGDFNLEVLLSPPVPLPTNDTCAMPATLVPSVSQMIDANAGAADYPQSCANPSGGDVVYQFTTTVPQKLTLTATGMNGADAVLSLRGAPCDDNTAELVCADDEGSTNPERIFVRSLPAGTWFVVLTAFNGVNGQFGVELLLEPIVPPPANDTCAAPEVVTLTAGLASRLVDLTDANADVASDLCGSGADGYELVYEVLIPAGLTLTVEGTPVGSTLDPVLFARSPSCAMATSEVCVDATGSGGVETLVVPNASGAPKTVFVFVKAYRAARTGQVNLTFTAM